LQTAPGRGSDILMETAPPQGEDRARAYWTERPQAARQSAWLANSIIERTLYRRISGGESSEHWVAWLFRSYFSGRRFRAVLSPGCGTGSHEVMLAELGAAERIDAFDFSETALAAARELARHARVDVNFYSDDINSFTVREESKYDLVFCSGSVHHVKELERFFAAVKAALVADGYFVFNEYVGQCYNIYDPKQVEIINRLYRCFPPELRSGVADAFANATIDTCLRQDPSESVRSKLILDFAGYYFDVELLRPYGGGILHPMYPLLNHEALASDDARSSTIVKLLLEFEEILMEAPGGLTSDFVLCVCRPK